LDATGVLVHANFSTQSAKRPAHSNAWKYHPESGDPEDAAARWAQKRDLAARNRRAGPSRAYAWGGGERRARCARHRWREDEARSRCGWNISNPI